MGFSGWADELLMPAQQQALPVVGKQTTFTLKRHILFYENS
jgi:hypothetical protein